MLFRGRDAKMIRRYVARGVMLKGADAVQSADTSVAAKATGAMSYVSLPSFPQHSLTPSPQAFIASLTRYPQQSYMQLLNSLRDELKGKYSQKPQLSASHPMVCLSRVLGRGMELIFWVGLQLVVHCLICLGSCSRLFYLFGSWNFMHSDII